MHAKCLQKVKSQRTFRPPARGVAGVQALEFPGVDRAGGTAPLGRLLLAPSTPSHINLVHCGANVALFPSAQLTAASSTTVHLVGREEGCADGSLVRRPRDATYLVLTEDLFTPAFTNERNTKGIFAFTKKGKK